MREKDRRTGCCDFHLYTARSIGICTAEELVKRCVEEGNIRVLSITDRNAVYSEKELCCLSERYQVEIIPGVELSCTYTLESGRQKEIHIAGYHVDPAHPKLQEVLKEKGRLVSFYRACQAVLAAGGVPILAHLCRCDGLDSWDRELLVKDFAECTGSQTSGKQEKRESILKN